MTAGTKACCDQNNKTVFSISMYCVLYIESTFNIKHARYASGGWPAKSGL